MNINETTIWRADLDTTLQVAEENDRVSVHIRTHKLEQGGYRVFDLGSLGLSIEKGEFRFFLDRALCELVATHMDIIRQSEDHDEQPTPYLGEVDIDGASRVDPTTTSLRLVPAFPASSFAALADNHRCLTCNEAITPARESPNWVHVSRNADHLAVRG